MELVISLLPFDNMKTLNALKNLEGVDEVHFFDLIKGAAIIEISVSGNEVISMDEVNPQNEGQTFKLEEWLRQRRSVSEGVARVKDWVITAGEVWPIEKYLSILDEVQEFIDSGRRRIECLPARGSFTLADCKGCPRWMAWAEVKAMTDILEITPIKVEKGELVFLNPLA